MAIKHPIGVTEVVVSNLALNSDLLVILSPVAKLLGYHTVYAALLWKSTLVVYSIC